jgi:hypothetical protein
VKEVEGQCIKVLLEKLLQLRISCVVALKSFTRELAGE